MTKLLETRIVERPVCDAGVALPAIDNLYSVHDTSFLLTEDECYPCHISPRYKKWLQDGTISGDIYF